MHDSIYTIYNLEEHTGGTPTVIIGDSNVRPGSEAGDTILNSRAYMDRNLRWAGIERVDFDVALDLRGPFWSLGRR